MVQKVFGIREAKMGPKLVNCCRPEQMGTKEFSKMMKRIQILEEGRVPAKEAKNRKIDGEKKRITRKEKRGCSTILKWKAFMAQGMWNLVKEKS